MSSDELYAEVKQEWFKLEEQINSLCIKANKARWQIAYDYDLPAQERKLEEVSEIESYLAMFLGYFTLEN